MEDMMITEGFIRESDKALKDTEVLASSSPLLSSLKLSDTEVYEP
jgi:hypothetical protein